MFTESAHPTPLYEQYGMRASAVALSASKMFRVFSEESNAALDEMACPLDTSSIALEFDHVLTGL